MTLIYEFHASCKNFTRPYVRGLNMQTALQNDPCSQVREIGAMLQLLPLILVPFVAVVQSCRYMLYVDSAEVSIL